MASERKYPPHEVLARLESFCAYQERCTFEISRKLLEWGYASEEADEFVASLQGKGFLDDERFAESFLSGKFNYKKWGRIKLRYELRARKIGDELVRRVVAEIDPEVYFSVLTELAVKKWPEIKGKDTWDRKAKLTRFLAAKGYELDLISEAINQL
jgi:regulatory protein